MTFLQIAYFLSVAERKSISKAADDLYVSRTAISRALRELEEEFDSPLFTRTLNGVELTPIGQIVLKRFEELQRKNETLERVMRKLKTQLEESTDRKVKMCITPITVCSLFPKLYRAVKEKYPDIEILIMEADHYQAKNMIENGSLDLHMTADAAWGKQSEQVEWLVFFKQEYVICMTPDNPLAQKKILTMEDIRNEPMIFLDQHYAYRSRLEEMFSKRKWEPNVVMRTYQFAAVQEMVRRGFGCTPMPAGVLEDGKEIISIPLDEQTDWETALLWNNHIHHNSAFYDILGVARNLVGQNGKEGVT